MLPKDTTQTLDWFKTEARRLNKDELYQLYTNTGDSRLHTNDEIAQIILINQTNGVDVYFTSASEQEETEYVFDGDDSQMDAEVHPLKLWLSSNSVSSAFQLKTTSETDEIEPLELDLEENRSLLKQIISAMEGDDSERLIAISIAPDFNQDYDNDDDDEDKKSHTNYFCRPIEIRSRKSNNTLISKFSQLNTVNYNYKSTNCSAKSAVDAILHAKIEYRGKNSVTLVGENLKVILDP